MRKIWQWIVWLFTGKTYGRGIIKQIQEARKNETIISVGASEFYEYLVRSGKINDNLVNAIAEAGKKVNDINSGNFITVKGNESNNYRWNMCKDQLVQIDCRNDKCRFNNSGGNCSNISPAITLQGKSYICWTQEEIKKEQ